MSLRKNELNLNKKAVFWFMDRFFLYWHGKQDDFETYVFFKGHSMTTWTRRGGPKIGWLTDSKNV